MYKENPRQLYGLGHDTTQPTNRIYIYIYIYIWNKRVLETVV